MEDVRVRFAPSPTGGLHVGGARTALFNWLFARKHGGSFILRIDDTDKERSAREYYNSIIESLKWLGLDWDEGPDRGGDFGPYIQSERLSVYRKEAQRLLDEGKAYLCFCTAEELSMEKEEYRKKGLPPRYSGKCKYLSSQERQMKKEKGQSYVIRLLTPEEGETVVEDVIRGWVTFDNKQLDDLIIIKSDGLPTYNFASIVDDNYMKVSHVIRAEEHLSNTPRQQIIARQLGYKLPVFAHVPMILAPDHSKLSKRHGATSVQEYRDMGILPEALLNYLALLGWSPGEGRELLNLEEMIQLFSLEKVTKNPAIYDLKKLIWFNGHYLRTIDLDRILKAALPFFQNEGFVGESPTEEEILYLKKVIGVVRDRVKTLKETVEASNYFFTDNFPYEQAGVEKHFQKGKKVGFILNQISNTLAQLDPFEKDKITEALINLSKELGISQGKINLPARLAITGRTMGPDLVDIIYLLGKDKVVTRVKKAVEIFELDE